MLWNRLAVVTALALGTMTSQVLAESVTLDKETSKIEFLGTKSDGKHDGGFKKFDAKADADFENPAQSSLKVEIETNSLWSDNQKLTNHLKNPDFFDVRKHPKITFESTEVVPGEDGKGTITGKLTMLGETQEIKIPVKTEATEEQITVDADFKLDRTKWGMDYGQGNVHNDVSVKARLVFKR